MSTHAVVVMPVDLDAITAIARERERQTWLGYDADHDDRHGPSLITLAEHKLNLSRMPASSYGESAVKSRKLFVEAAALIVAAIESLDRAYPPESTDPASERETRA